MASLFGEDWQAELAAARTRAASHDNRVADQGAEVSSPSEVHSPTAGGRRVWRSPKRTRPDGEEDAAADELQSSAGSEGSWRNMSNEEVEAMLTDAFRVKEESLVAFERRVARARAVLQLRVIASDAEAAHRAIQAARLADRYQKSGGLAALNNEIAEALDKNDQDEYLDSLVSAVQLLGGDGVRKILRPTVRPKAGPSARIASPCACVLSQPAIPPSSPCRPAEDLAEAFEDALSEASRATETVPAHLVKDLLDAAKQRTKSTIQIKPDVSWPSLNDGDQDIETFFEDLEDICGLANDATGMSAVERLRVLGNCLKQSRKKVYRVKLKEARKSGLLLRDPGQVYDEIRDRLMEFRETALERQNRVENEFNNLTKGTLKALQFLPMFESVTSEMDMCGVGLSERQLLLGYLRKVGSDYRREILKDRRLYASPTGGPEEMRNPQTWREAHRVLLEIESVSAGTKALVAAVGMADQKEGPQLSKAARKKMQKELEGTPDVNAIGGQQVCFRARDNGTCDRTDCSYSHDPALLASARKEKSAKEARQGGGKNGGKARREKDKGK